MSRLLYGAATVLVATTSLAAGQQSVVGQTTTSARAAARSTAPRPLTARTNGLTSIHGNVLDATNGNLANVVVRLRDARYGRIVETELTDKSGLFEFRTLDPGSYIVELIGNRSTVLAASQIMNVEAGEIVSAVVQLPLLSPLLATAGSSTVASAAAIVTEAVATGVVAVIATDPVSPIE
ncbi:MAG: carboxypeptidase regulatory-like domain-containing protein [Acidobacteria bacterium]|nr:carboxypeptidase regulatory-like domain-containing protein [Acidobacteriota bacterium]